MYDAHEWACWAVLGDPYARVPITLRELIERVEQAVSQAVRDAKREEAATWQKGAP